MIFAAVFPETKNRSKCFTSFSSSNKNKNILIFFFFLKTDRGIYDQYFFCKQNIDLRLLLCDMSIHEVDDYGYPQLPLLCSA